MSRIARVREHGRRVRKGVTTVTKHWRKLSRGRKAVVVVVTTGAVAALAQRRHRRDREHYVKEVVHDLIIQGADQGRIPMPKVIKKAINKGISRREIVDAIDKLELEGHIGRPPSKKK